MTINFKKMNDAGITDLKLIGCEIVEDCVFSENDAIKNDYSSPVLQGEYNVRDVKHCSSHYLVWLDGVNDALVLTEAEYEAGVTM